MRLVARQRDLNFEPGAEFLYSNTGYLLLSEVVTKVGGRPFGEWMKVNVFDPLGMTSTQIYDDHERLVPGRAYSYRYSEDGLSKAVLSYANSGATSLFTTAEDLARWLLNFRTGQVGGQEAIDLLQVPGVLNDEGEGEAAGADSEAVPAELGKALAGTFEIENGPYVTITYEGERLSAQAEGRPKVALLPEGELVFRLDITEADIRIEFEAGPGGAFDRATFHQNGETPMKRVAEWEPDDEALAAYAGRYYSHELETFYTVELEDEGLTIGHRRHGDFALSPKEKDVFACSEWYIGKVSFERDETDRVASLRMGGGRVRGLLLERVDADAPAASGGRD
jgi:hypothetical protein